MEWHQFVYRFREVRGGLFLGAILGAFVAFTVWIPFGHSWRTALAWLAAGAAAGATWASLAALFQVENPETHVLILPVSGAVGAVAFWLVSGQQQTVGYIVLAGALLVPTLFFFEELLSGKHK